MSKAPLKEFTVTLGEHLDEDFIKTLYETGFLGLCEQCKRSSDPRVLRLWPSEEEERAVRAQLEEFEEGGAVAFTESPAASGNR